MDEVMGVEPTSSVWQTEVLTVELHLDGADGETQTHSHSITSRERYQLRHIGIKEKSSVSSFNLTHSLWISQPCFVSRSAEAQQVDTELALRVFQYWEFLLS